MTGGRSTSVAEAMKTGDIPAAPTPASPVIAGGSRMFSLEINFEAFMMKDSDGRKSSSKGRVVNWAMELGTITFDLLLSRLSNEVSWSSNQKCTIWFYDKTLCEDVMLVDDVQFQHMFEMYKSKMHCQVLVVVMDKTVWEQHEWSGYKLHPCLIGLTGLRWS